MIRTYWLLVLAMVALSAAVQFGVPGLGVLALGAAFVWWDSTPGDDA